VQLSDGTERDAGADRIGRGFNAQVGYAIPVGSGPRQQFVELAVRTERFDPGIAMCAGLSEIDCNQREDELRAQRPGDRGADRGQAYWDTAVGVNWFLGGHDLKLQVFYTYRYGVDDWANSTRAAQAAARAQGLEEGERQVKNNAFYAQMTYRS
jgi:hypothetical protein